MNRNIIKLLSFCLFRVICFTSCERYPVSALLGIPNRIDSWPEVWYLYDDEINTKGSLAPFKWESYTGCADWDKVALDFSCKDHPKNGRRCVKLTWVGNSNDPGKTYFGFGLKATEQDGRTINLSTSGYTKLKFWIRGTLYNNCSFQIKVPKNETESWAKSELLTNSDINVGTWKEYVVALPTEDMDKVEYDISISLIANGTTNGGTVYLDDIRFTRD